MRGSFLRGRAGAWRWVAATSLFGLALLAPAAAAGLPADETAPPSELFLAGVSTNGATDAWAVGGYEQGSYPPVTERWDGTTWTKVPAPQPLGAINSAFTSVVDMGPSSAWAVGDYYMDGRPHALTEQWNGTSWAQVSDAVPGDAVAADLEAVASPDPGDVWAVGVVDMSDGSGGGFLEHWNGNTWKALKLAKRAYEFTGLTFDSPTDGWAVGLGRHGTAAYHWDGTRWSFVPSPSPGDKSDEGFHAVTALSPGDAWAVGDYSDEEHQRLVPYIEHWDGTAWTAVDTPTGSGRELLLGMTSVSATDIWAVGGYSTSKKSAPIIEHWNGVDWEVVKSPHLSMFVGLNGVSATTATDVWAVGVNESKQGPHPFIVHWDGTRWSHV